MILSRRVSLAGVQLDELDERIVISKVEEELPEENRSSVNLYGDDGIGSRQTFEHLAGKKVNVSFQLRINKRDYAERQAVLEAVTAWARPGGTLRSSTRPERKIQVRCVQKPKVVDPRKLDAEYTMIFEAREKPYWMSTTPVSAVSRTTSSGTVKLVADGNLPSVLEMELENKSGAKIANMSITCGSYTMSFDALDMAANETLVIDHNSLNVQRIRIRNAQGSYRSVMSKRSGADEFVVEPGDVTVTFSSQRAVQATVKCTGRYA